MKLTLQVVIQHDDELPRVSKIASIERDTLTPETLGLSLQEAKTVLAQLQEMLVTEQVAAVVVEHQTCPQCGAAQRRKGQHQIVVRSLFGKLTLASPRLYTCACQGEETRRSHSPLAELLPERTTPEPVSPGKVGCTAALRRDSGRAGGGAADGDQSHDGVSAVAAGR